MEDIQTTDDPLLDTKEQLRNIARQLLRERDERDRKDAELRERVKKIADAIDLANGKRDKWSTAFLRALKQFLSLAE